MPHIGAEREGTACVAVIIFVETCEAFLNPNWMALTASFHEREVHEVDKLVLQTAASVTRDESTRTMFVHPTDIVVREIL